jgi:hypothetical protein
MRRKRMAKVVGDEIAAAQPPSGSPRNTLAIADGLKGLNRVRSSDGRGDPLEDAAPPSWMTPPQGIELEAQDLRALARGFEIVRKKS